MNKKYYLLILLATGLVLPCSYLSAAVHTIHVGTGGNMAFYPDNLTVAAGDTVEWIWDDGFHTTTSGSIPSGAASWDAPLDPGNTSYRYVPVISGTYNYVCTPHSSMGMTGQFTVTCVAPGVPSVTPAGPLSGCAGDSGLLLEVAASAGVTFHWRLNGDTIAGAHDMYYLPDTTGSYSCTVSNSCGNNTSNTVSVTVLPVPEPSFTFTVTGLSYAFTNTTPQPADWRWDFGDGDTSMQQHPSHTYAQPGGYTVILTATNTANSCSRSSSQTIFPGSGVGLKTLSEAGVTVSPNPASSSVRVSAGAAVISSCTLYDISGKRVAVLPIRRQTANDIHLDVSLIPAGNYILQIATTENIIITGPLSIRR